MNSLIWFRSDLRVQDNMALHYATTGSYKHCYAVYVVSQDQWDKHSMGNVKRRFMLNHVRSLKDQLHTLGIPLIVLDVPLYADIPQALSELCVKHGITELFANYEYPVNEIQRDQAVVNHLQAQDVNCHFYHDYVVHKPGSLRNQSSEYYKVFTPFKKNWLSRITDESLQEYKAVAKEWPEDIKLQDIEAGLPDSEELALWPVQDVHKKLLDFVHDKAVNYKRDRDFPDIEGTSCLSPYLAIGAISIRACFRYARFENEGLLAGGKPGIDTWISELIWREFYQHILIGFPKVCKSQPFQDYTKNIAWRSSTEDLQAWKDGKTGVPIVDAAMRQLNETGWMHNRLRMVVAMFLTKNLLINWREGEDYFMEKLVDGEFGANNGGWQWAASTGTDAAPYFRIFNPVSQSQRFDPKGCFIRRYVPEIAHLDNKRIHEPYMGKKNDLLLDELHYPYPIVDLKVSRQGAIDAFKQAKQLWQ